MRPTKFVEKAIEVAFPAFQSKSLCPKAQQEQGQRGQHQRQTQSAIGQESLQIQKSTQHGHHISTASCRLLQETHVDENTPFLAS